MRERMKIIYIYDALCGWCYGFSPVITQFHEKYKDEVEIEVLSGGMITGKRIGPIGEVAPYIRWAYKDVEKATGVTFGSHFLNSTLALGEAIFTSIPPAIALSVFKSMSSSGSSLSFVSEIQKAIYYKGIEPKDYKAYGKIAASFGLDASFFILKMNNSLYQTRAEEDFKKVVALGVSGFPTVLMETNGAKQKIVSGYRSLDQLEHIYLNIKHKNV